MYTRANPSADLLIYKVTVFVNFFVFELLLLSAQLSRQLYNHKYGESDVFRRNWAKEKYSEVDFTMLNR